MGYITIGILGFTGVCLLFGLLLGIIRGTKRSVLRLIIVAGCAVAAFFLRNVFVETIKNIEIGGKTVTALIEEALASGLGEQESIANMITALVDIIISLACYFVIFIALQLVTWMIVFPIFKLIFFSSDRKLKDSGIPVNQHRFIGMLIGLIQGAFVAFVLVVPLNGLVFKANALSKIEIEGQPAVNVPEEIGLDEYVNSPYCKVYSVAGNWYFEMLTTGSFKNSADEDQAISISAAVDVVVTGAKFAEEITAITNKMQEIRDSSDGITSADAAALKQSFNNIDELIDNLSDTATDLLEGMVTDLAKAVSGGEIDNISEYIPEDFSLKAVDFSALGDAFEVVVSLNEDTALTEAQATTIVNAFAKNEVIVNVISDNYDNGIIESADDKATVNAAIETAEVSPELKAKLRAVLLGE